MRKLIWIVVLGMFSCSQQQNGNAKHPSFKGNGKLQDVWEPIREIASQQEFAIAYSEGGPLDDPGSRTHKLLCLNEGKWKKIQYISRLIQIDTIANKEAIVERDVILKKECDETESKALLNKLTELGLFSLLTEEELVKECENNGGKLTIRFDAGNTTFYLIEGSKVRIVSYNDLYFKAENCPGQYKNILALRGLFEEDWFSKNYFDLVVTKPIP